VDANNCDCGLDNASLLGSYFQMCFALITILKRLLSRLPKGYLQTRNLTWTLSVANNQQLTETTYHTVEHDMIAIIFECISLVEVKVMILVFDCLAQFMKCDEPQNHYKN
jgi:hypothetical protein